MIIHVKVFNMVKKSWLHDIEEKDLDLLTEYNCENARAIYEGKSPYGSYYELGEPKDKGHGIYFVDTTA